MPEKAFSLQRDGQVSDCAPDLPDPVLSQTSFSSGTSNKRHAVDKTPSQSYGSGPVSTGLENPNLLPTLDHDPFDVSAHNTINHYAK
jgi:hypothetical protein